ncbi:MAG: vitamin K epoxide reductase family protein [Planctomycetota bacterium]|jgi:uncharacterized membrane protein/predicted DsbA family dithiol-disulfide isomerase
MATRIALVCALIACVLGLVLRCETAQHEVTGAASSCTISENIDCDAVQTSSYAKLFGVSVSLWATAGSGLLAALLLLVPRFGDGMKVLVGLLALMNGVTSLIYMFISLFVLGVNCLYCNGIQVLSIITMVCLAPAGWRVAGGGVPRRTMGAAALAGGLALLFTLLGDGYAQGRTELGQLKADTGGAGMRIDVANAMLLGDPVRGAENSYVIYFDFGCPKCLGCYGTAKKVLKDHPDRVHFFFKHWPLDRRCNPTLHRTAHEGACMAAAAGTAFAGLGKSAQALEALFNMDTLFTKKRLEALGPKLGVDLEEFKKLLHGKNAKDAVARHVAEGNTLDFAAVPVIFRNGRREREVRLPRR